jgi:tRNA-dihydrouridine synthase 2
MLSLLQSPLSIPVIANGDVFERSDIEKLRKDTGVSSVMIARGALKNPSIFATTQQPLHETIRDYLKKVRRKKGGDRYGSNVLRKFVFEIGHKI